jgi:hypothetical protein
MQLKLIDYSWPSLITQNALTQIYHMDGEVSSLFNLCLE